MLTKERTKFNRRTNKHDGMDGSRYSLAKAMGWRLQCSIMNARSNLTVYADSGSHHDPRYWPVKHSPALLELIYPLARKQ